MKSLFHFAFNVTDLDIARAFYGGVLGCSEGRSSATWVDFDFFSHQISLHLGPPFKTENTGLVGDTLVPMPHFGLVLTLPDWQAMAARLKAANTAFVMAPQLRFGCIGYLPHPPPRFSFLRTLRAGCGLAHLLFLQLY